MDPILQSRLGALPPGYGRLPGTAPLEMAGWLTVDDAYGAQMAEREQLLAARRGEVMALEPGREAVADEALRMVLAHLEARDEWGVAGGVVTCPDGRRVGVDARDPLGTLGRLVAEDICLLEPRDGAQVLIGAVLCFPSRWVLAEKMGRALLRIHQPVPGYGADLNARVERMMAALRPGMGLWRANGHYHSDPTLFYPRSEVSEKHWEARARYFRSERQGLLRMPETGAVLFSIHTTVVEASALTAEQRARIAASEHAAE
ncbi:heme-dependent oxidative N-demethylase family protein [Vannielia litorea]|uniref:heme-dependent oxidative N-demethylase family protein n=1 Tax=Vannielia litorea TaxID=1217970 RepID=UPI001BCD5F4C|nr:DUF3445 domain-containing protein [Vannielia litorea]MBS8228463.1 DUF3445 domain-containing protein [Vannielia litorea]